MGDSYDIIIIGLGVMGAAACAECAKRRGVKVLGIDRYVPPHAHGSSHGSTRIFRVAYYEHPDYVPLLKQAREKWCELNDESGRDIFVPTGGLWMAQPEHALASDTRAAAEQHGLAYEWLSQADVVERWPQFNIAPDFIGYFEKDAGTLRAEIAVEALLALAKRRDASIVTGCAVKSIEPSANGVVVTTGEETLHAARVIVTAGPWSSQLLKSPEFGIGSRLTVTRHAVAWIKPKRIDQLIPDVLPCWAVARSDNSFYYGFPVMANDPGAKVAIHGPGESTSPRNVYRSVRVDECEELQRAIGRILPAALGPIAATSVCMYTNTPDGHFILDRMGEHRNIVVGCGFSGHGFKFAPVVGEALADLAINGDTDLPIEFLSAKRFDQ